MKRTEFRTSREREREKSVICPTRWKWLIESLAPQQRSYTASQRTERKMQQSLTEIDIKNIPTKYLFPPKSYILEQFHPCGDYHFKSLKDDYLNSHGCFILMSGKFLLRYKYNHKNTTVKLRHRNILRILRNVTLCFILYWLAWMLFFPSTNVIFSLNYYLYHENTLGNPNNLN